MNVGVVARRAGDVATWVPVSEEMLADYTIDLWTWLERDLRRQVTAMAFDEDWFNADLELTRLEHGRSLSWDIRYYEGEECEC